MVAGADRLESVRKALLDAVSFHERQLARLMSRGVCQTWSKRPMYRTLEKSSRPEGLIECSLIVSQGQRQCSSTFTFTCSPRDINLEHQLHTFAESVSIG